MNALILVRGLPGSGKSTYADRVSKLNDKSKVFEADQFFIDSFGNYNFNAKLLPVAHATCLANAFNWIMEDCDNIAFVANTFTTNREMKPYLDFADQIDIKVDIIEMKENYGSIHGVPQTSINAMEERWEELSYLVGE